mmetsp:Transcript_48951/g.122648  ORF Transcript_48951/g.122648 Transcript_48951/m.122648 type:complete len:205 (-) Transcript_48951:226-840(-)
MVVLRQLVQGVGRTQRPHSYVVIVAARCEEFAVWCDVDSADPIGMAHVRPHAIPGFAIPQLECVVSRARHQLLAGRHETDSRDGVVVSAHGLDALHVGAVPQTDAHVRRTRGKPVAVCVEVQVVDGIGVPLQGLLQPSIALVVPYLDGGVVRCGEDQRVCGVEGHSSDAPPVAAQHHARTCTRCRQRIGRRPEFECALQLLYLF